MARSHRQPAPALTNPPTKTGASALEALLLAPEQFDLFAALRAIECAFPAQPRLAEARRPREEPARLGQRPFTIFAPAQIAQAKASDGRVLINQFVFGLFGPQGPLPQHVTVLALNRDQHAHDSTLADFADIFHHRVISLFYRAWARARPAVEHDRPLSDRFSSRVGAIAGRPAAAFGARTSLSNDFVLHAAGLLAAQTSTPEKLERLFALCFSIPIRIREFVGAWLDIPVQEQGRLGGPAASCGLGRAMVGPRVYVRHTKFRIILGPLSLPEFRTFLPDGQKRILLRALVDRAVGLDLDWDIQLVLRREDVPGAELDRNARLGWTSWVATNARATDAGEVVLDGEPACLVPA